MKPSTQHTLVVASATLLALCGACDNGTTAAPSTSAGASAPAPATPAAGASAGAPSAAPPPPPLAAMPSSPATAGTAAGAAAAAGATAAGAGGAAAGAPAAGQAGSAPTDGGVQPDAAASAGSSAPATDEFDPADLFPPISTPDTRVPSPDNPAECPKMAPENPVGDCLGLPVYLACSYGTYNCVCDWFHWLCFG